MTIVINFVLFQIGWFACVLGAAHGQELAGSLAALAIVAFHLTRALTPIAEIKLVLLAGLLGGVWDSALVVLGLIAYPSGMLIAGAAPYWIVIMWMLFATTLNVSLRWLKQHPFLAIPLGAIGGPFAYYAGEVLGALTFIEWQAAIVAQAIGWGVLLPIIVMLSKRYDGMTATPQLRLANV